MSEDVKELAKSLARIVFSHGDVLPEDIANLAMCTGKDRSILESKNNAKEIIYKADFAPITLAFSGR